LKAKRREPLRVATASRAREFACRPVTEGRDAFVVKHPDLKRYIKHGTLTQLAVFEAVARLGSFTRAGEELHMAQPTVSVQVKKLATTVGLPLFEQTGRKITLTEAGRELYALCQSIFDRIMEVEGRLAGLRTRSGARLRIAVSTTGKYFAPRLIGKFWEAHPGVEVSLSVMNRQLLLHRLESELDDLYVLSDPPAVLGAVAHTLMPNPLYVYARDDHPLAQRRGVSLAEVVREPLLLREPGSGTRLACEEIFAAHGVQPEARLELDSNEAIKQSIVAGLGVAILSRHAVGLETRRGHLVQLDVEGFPVMRHWYLVHAESRPLAPMAQRFVEHALRPDVVHEIAEPAE
jgi:DNA-binding transcriptional LysR family regulator